MFFRARQYSGRRSQLGHSRSHGADATATDSFGSKQTRCLTLSITSGTAWPEVGRLSIFRPNSTLRIGANRSAIVNTLPQHKPAQRLEVPLSNAEGSIAY